MEKIDKFGLQINNEIKKKYSYRLNFSNPESTVTVHLNKITTDSAIWWLTCLFSLFFFSSGCRSGAIYHHDVRVANHHVATLARHTQEVCGLKWSPDGKYLASGGNDNLLMIWDASVNTANNTTTPVFTFNQHQAAVKVCK